MTKYVCVPLYLFPNERIEFTRCEVVPGVKVQRISKALTDFVRQQNDKIPPGHRPSFFSSHVIMIELQKHFDYLTALLGQEGRQIPKHPFEKNNIERSELYVEADSVTRHVVMALVLTGGLQFRVGGYHTLKVNTVHKMPKYIASGYSHHISEGSYLQNPFSSIDAMDSTNSRLLKKQQKACSGTTEATVGGMIALESPSGTFGTLFARHIWIMLLSASRWRSKLFFQPAGMKSHIELESVLRSY